MNCNIENINGVYVLTPAEKKAIEEKSRDFKKILFDVIENKGEKNILIDLSQIEFADSSFLGSIVSGLKRVSSEKGDIKICGLQPTLKSLFELTRLYKVFEIYDNKEDALSSFQI